MARLSRFGPGVRESVVLWCCVRHVLGAVMTGRQESIPMPTNSQPAPDANGSPSLSMAVIIPIAVILGITILLVIVLRFRRRLVSWLRSPNPASESSDITAEQLSGTAGTGAAETSRGADAAARGPRGRRGVRRTESGMSVRTLPAYSKEAGDEELVLVQQRNNSDIAEEEEDEAGVGDTSSAALLPDQVDPQTPFRSPSQRTTRQPDETLESGSGSSSPGPEEILEEPPLTAPPAQDRPVGRRTLSNLSRRGWGEAPTYLEAMSSPPFPSSLECGVPPPRTPSVRQRTSSGFRDLLSRAGMTFPPANRGRIRHTHSQSQGSRHSSTSLLLQPQTSRLSTLTSATSTPGRSTSPYPSPWASTQSFHISSPVPNTAVLASFDSTTIPRAGLSDEQMRFLSSSEAVNLAGVRLGDVPASKRRRRSEATPMGSRRGEGGEADEGQVAGDLPPPSWEEIDGERRRNEAEARRGLAMPVTRNTSEEGPLPAPDGSLSEAPIPKAAGVDDERPSTLAPLRSPDAPLAPLHTASTIPAPSVEVEPPTPSSPSPPEVVVVAS